MATVQKRGNSYFITVTNGYINGKQVRETRTYKPDTTQSKRQQEIALNQFVANFEAEVRAGKTTGNRMTLITLYGLWYKDYVLKELEQSSHGEFKARFEKIILPQLGKYHLLELTPMVIDKFLRDLEEGGRADGKEGGYAPKTIRKIRSILSSCLQYAVQYGLLPSNPCSVIRRNHRKVVQQKLKYWTPQQTQTFLQIISKPIPIYSKRHKQTRHGKVIYLDSYFTGKYLDTQLKYRTLFNIVIFTGLRRGEVLALRWSDIDYQERTIKIQHAIGNAFLDGHSVQYEKAPKTEAGFRTISVPQNVIDLCRQLQIEQHKTILKLGTAWKGNRNDLDSNYLFTTPEGEAMNVSTPYHEFQRILNCYNKTVPESEQLPVIPLHGLRHTNCTLMIANDVDIKTIMTRMGHSDISVTTGIYGHELKEREQAASDVLEDVLLKTKNA